MHFKTFDEWKAHDCNWAYVDNEESARAIWNAARASDAAASEPDRLPDGSGFMVASLPLPSDHWLYAPSCAGWDEVRDTSADTPHPILTHAQRDAVAAAVRYAVRGATMCGKERDFDPDALVLNAVYALCGPFNALVESHPASDPQSLRFGHGYHYNGVNYASPPEGFDLSVQDALHPASEPKALTDEPIEAFLAEVRAELIRARTKFPGDRVMTIALAEEFGELCKAVLDESAANVRKEAVQTAVMCARVVLDGDGSVNDWRAERGLDPLAEVAHD